MKFYLIIFSLSLIHAANSRQSDLIQTARDLLTNKWTLIASVALCIACIAATIGCVCCREPSSLSTSNASIKRYQENADDKSDTIEDSVVIEPLPDVAAQRFLTHQQNASLCPKPMDYNCVINKGLIADQIDWSKASSKTKVDRNQMKYIREIAVGWFGHVIEGELYASLASLRLSRSKKVAVKILNSDLNSVERAYVLYSDKKFRDSHHENVVSLVTACLEAQPYLLIYEFFGLKSELKQFLHKNRARCDEFLEKNLLLNYALNVAKGLSYLLDRDYVMTDLACRNCYVEDNVVKIADYGVGHALHKNDYVVVNDMAIPLRWCAPECLTCSRSSRDSTQKYLLITKEIDKKSNIWTFGIVFWEIMEFAKMPYPTMSDDEVMQQIFVDQTGTLQEPLVPMRLRDKCYKVIQRCLDFDPESRPQISRILDMLEYIDNSYRLLSNQASLCADFETKWANLVEKPDQSHSTRSNSHDEIMSHLSLESIDKRNFILTLNDEELCKLTDDELNNFGEYLVSEEMASIKRKKSNLLNQRKKHSKNFRAELEPILESWSSDHLSDQDISEARQIACDEEKSLSAERVFKFLTWKIRPDSDVSLEEQAHLMSKFIDFLDQQQADLIRDQFRANAAKKRHRFTENGVYTASVLDQDYKVIQRCLDFDPESRPQISRILDMLEYIDNSYRLLSNQASLCADFETKWANLVEKPDQSHSTRSNSHDEIMSQLSLESIDKRNFILTLNDEELCKLTDDELNNFGEYLVSEEMASIKRKKSNLLNQRKKHSKNFRAELEPILESWSSDHLSDQDISEARQIACDEEKSLSAEGVFKFLKWKIRPDSDVSLEEQSHLMSKFIDFLDQQQADLIRDQFRANAAKMRHRFTENGVDPVSVLDQESFAETPKSEGNMQADSKNGFERKTSTPSEKDKKMRLSLTPLNDSPLNNVNKSDSDTKRQSFAQFERMRREVTSVSDETLWNTPPLELEEKYFSFMSSQEILDMLLRKKAPEGQQDTDSSSLSFYKKPVPSYDVTENNSAVLADSLRMEWDNDPTAFGPTLQTSGRLTSPDDASPIINQSTSNGSEPEATIGQQKPMVSPVRSHTVALDMNVSQPMSHFLHLAPDVSSSANGAVLEPEIDKFAAVQSEASAVSTLAENWREGPDDKKQTIEALLTDSLPII